MRDGWAETTLGDVAEWWSGGTPKAREPKYYENGTIPWAVIADMNKGIIDSTNSYITKEALELIGGRLAPVGSVLISMYASVGKSAIANIPLATNQAIAWSIPNQKKIIPFYLYLVSQQLEKEISDLARGATQRNINRQMLREFTFQLPPLPEQKRIVDLISSVDSYIEALQQQLESAKRSRNAVLHELLTSGGDDWIETTLGEICADGLFADGDWVESKDQDPEGDYRLLQLADIGDGTFLNKSDRWMNREQFNRLGCTKLEVNDVLIARMPDPIGRACLLPEGLPVCATVVDVAIVRTGNETLQKFLALLINSSDFRTEAFSLLTGTTRQRISRGNLAKISFVIPSQEKQLEIVNLISLFDGEIAQSVRVIEEAKQLRSGLLSDLLSGEHEIPASYDKVMGAA